MADNKGKTIEYTINVIDNASKSVKNITNNIKEVGQAIDNLNKKEKAALNEREKNLQAEHRIRFNMQKQEEKEREKALQYEQKIRRAINKEQNTNELKKQQQLNKAINAYTLEIHKATTAVESGHKVSTAFYANSIAQTEKYRQQIKELGGDISKLKSNPLTKDNIFQKSYATDIGSIARFQSMWNTVQTVIDHISGTVKEINSQLISMEQNMSKVQQNLELYDKYKSNDGAKLLTQDLDKLRDASIMFGIVYGEKIDDITESLTILSRRFKDTDVLLYMQDLALQMSRLDNIPLQEVATDIESIALQLKLTPREARDFVNYSAVAVHSTRITGQELLSAMKQSSAAFKATKADIKDVIALISTLATTTGREGGVVGRSLRGFLTYIQKDTKKMNEAFGMLGIERYVTDENGRKVFREENEILSEILMKYNKLDDLQKSTFVNTVSGGVYRVNEVRSFIEAADIYKDIYEKIGEANDELSQELLLTSLTNYSAIFDRLNVVIDSLKLNIGEEFLPTIRELAEWLTDVGIAIVKNKEYVSSFVAMITRLSIVAGATISIFFGIEKVNLLIKAFNIAMGNSVTTLIEAEAAAKGVGAASVATGNGIKIMATEAELAAGKMMLLYSSMFAVAAAGAALYYAYKRYGTPEGQADIRRERISYEGNILDAMDIERDENGNVVSYIVKDQEKLRKAREMEGIDTGRFTIVTGEDENGNEIFDVQGGIEGLNRVSAAYEAKQNEEADYQKAEQKRRAEELKKYGMDDIDKIRERVENAVKKANETPATEPTGDIIPDVSIGGNGKSSGSSSPSKLDQFSVTQYDAARFQLQLAKELYDYNKKIYELNEQINGITEENSLERATNEVDMLNTYEKELNVLTKIQEVTDMQVADMYEANKGSLDSVLDKFGVSWNDLDGERKKRLVEAVVGKGEFYRLVEQQDSLRKEVEKTNISFREQQALVNKLSGMGTGAEEKRIERERQLSLEHQDRLNSIVTSGDNSWDTQQENERYAREQLPIARARARAATSAMVGASMDLSAKRIELEEAKRAFDEAVANGIFKDEEERVTAENNIKSLTDEVKELAISYNDAANKAAKANENVNKLTKDAMVTQKQHIDAIESATSGMFTNVFLEGKSFSESWKQLWNDIGRYAWQVLLKMTVFKWIEKGLGVGLSSGGEVGSYANGGSIPGYASGQYIKGAGTGKSDSILAYLANKDRFVFLSNGEYVMTAEATKRIGVNNLDAMNGYADGGMLNPTPYVPVLNSSTETAAKNLTPHSRTEELLMEQNRQMSEQLSLMRNMGQGGESKMVVLNTQASSADVIKAMQDNPRAVQALLGRQNRMGFR